MSCRWTRGASVVLILSAGAALALAEADVASGQTPPEQRQQPEADLGTVVVTATRSDTRLEDMPLNTTVVTRRDIEKSPAQTLDQLLRQIPGMNMPGAPFYTTDPTGHQTRLRGVTNSKVLVLLDGIPLHDPFYSTTQWFKVPLSAVERVEIIRGGISSLWGNLAVAGVINIITRRPEDSRGEVDASYGSMDTFNGAIAKDFSPGPGFGFRVTADALSSHGYQTTPGEYLSAFPGKGDSSARNSNATVSAFFSPAPDLKGFFRAGYHKQNEDVGGYQFGQNLQTGPDASLGVTRTFLDKSSLDFRAWTQYLYFDKYNGAGCYLQAPGNCNTTALSAPLVQYANSHDHNPYREYGASGVYSRDVPWISTSAQAGLDYRKVSGSDDALTFNRPATADSTSATVNRTNYGGGTQQFVGGFMQFRSVPVVSVQTTLSLRYDYWTNTDGVSQMTRFNNGVPGPLLGGAVPDSHKASFNPSFALRYDVDDDVSLRGAVYRSFRAPGLNNLYRSFSSTTSITIANPQLAPETLTGGEIGADFRARSVTLGATLFQYNTRGLITSYKVPNAAAAPPAVTAVCGANLSNCPANVNFNTNGQNATSRGLELAGRWQAMRTLSVDASYTFTRAYYTWTNTGDPTGLQLGAVPKHTATLGITWQTTTRWRNYLQVRYNGKMYLDVAQTIPRSDFTVLDVSSSYQATRDLEIYGAVTNATDIRYADNATTTATGETLGMPRAITAGLRLRF